MPFSINIFDRNDMNALTQFEVGERASLNLRWLGSANKLEFILGSELSFHMEVVNFQDAYFGHLNTHDERRYWVTIVDEETAVTRWEGHLLPDSYDEPYKVGSFFVGFVATCGLGTLKEQYLPNEYYDREKSKVAILAEILKLTGLQLEINICPAIRNKVSPKWHDNYLDGSKYKGDRDRDDAYTILKKLMESGPCRILQDNGQWYIEGLNKLNSYNLTYDRYDSDGNYLSTVTTERSPKDKIKNQFLADPRITTHTARKTIKATHGLDKSIIDTEVYDVPNDGYIVPSDTILTNRKWTYTNVNFTPKYSTANGRTFLAPAGSISNHIKMRKEVLLADGDRVQWNIECQNYWNGTGSTGQTVEELVLNGYWKKVLRYDIFYTDPSNGTEVLLYSNHNGPNSNDLRYQLEFGTDRKASLSIPMIAPATGLYNIRFYQPQVDFGAKVTGVFLDKLECVPVSQVDEQVYEDTIDESFTRSEELELHHHDDMRQLEGLVRLRPLAEQGGVYGTLTLNNLQVLDTSDGNYILMGLDALKAALEHRDGINVNGNPLLVTGHIYNYLGSTEMYLQYDADHFGGTVQDGDSMQITLREFAPVPDDIAQWQQWTDDFYGVGHKRFGEAYVEVVRRLFKNPHPLLSGTCKGFVSPRDLILFNYDGDKVWYSLDCEQHLDRYQSTGTWSQNFYGEAVTENLPPTVDAGPDQKLVPASTTATLTATASDPEGDIVAILWELISGDPSGVTINSPGLLSTYVTGLSGNDYEFRVTVTDGAGLTASDTVRINRDVSYTLVLTPTVDVEKSTTSENQDEFWAIDREWYDISISPDLNDDQVARVTINGILVRETPQFIAGAMPTTIFKLGYEYQFFEAGSHQMVSLFRRGDIKTLVLEASAFNSARYGIYPTWADKVHAKIQADITAEIIQGSPGAFTNVPIQIIVEARK